MTKRLLLAFVLFAALIGAGNRVVNRGGSGETQIASDNFTYSNGTSIAGLSNWDATLNDWTVDGNAATPGATSDLSCVYENSTYSANQYSQATFTTIGSNSAAGVAVRCQSGASTWYDLWYNIYDSEVELRRVNAGVQTAIQQTAKSPSTGYKLKLTVTGTGSSTRLSAYEDTGSGWVALWTNVDPGGTYIDGGKPGLAGYNATGGLYLDNWSGGNL